MLCDSNEACLQVLLLQTNEWSTACRRKNKQNQNVVRGVDTFDDELKESQNDIFDKPSSKGRGRGRNLKGRGKITIYSSSIILLY